MIINLFNYLLPILTVLSISETTVWNHDESKNVKVMALVNVAIWSAHKCTKKHININGTTPAHTMENLMSCLSRATPQISPIAANMLQQTVKCINSENQIL